MSKEKEPEAEKLVSLKDFIEVYQKTIAVMGAFVALGLLWKGIHSKESVPYISYLCFLITVPLLLEVRKGYNYAKSSWNLVAFINIFQGILMLTAYYLVVDYPDHFEKIIIGTIFSALFLSLMALIDRLSTKLKTSDYNNVVGIAESLERQGVPVAERNKTVTRLNFVLRGQYRLVSAMEVLFLILALIFSAFVAVYAGDYIHASFDLMLDRQIELEVPPSK